MPWVKNNKPQGLPWWGTRTQALSNAGPPPATLTPHTQAGELGAHYQPLSPILTDEKRKDTEAK